MASGLLGEPGPSAEAREDGRKAHDFCGLFLCVVEFKSASLSEQEDTKPAELDSTWPSTGRPLMSSAKLKF